MAFTPTRTVAGLAALALAAAGFYGGVEVQQHNADGSSATASAGPGGGGTGGPPSGAGATGGAGASTASSTATTGTVKSTKDGVLYVTTSDGATVKVKAPSTATVTRNAKTSAAQVHPGDSVVVEGTTASSGTISATSVTASSGAN